MDNGETVIHRAALCPQAPQPSTSFDKNFKVKTDHWPVNRYGYAAVNVSGSYTEADDAACKQGHHHQYPVAAKQDRFAAEQIDAPEAVFEVPDGCQPGRATGAGVVWSVVLGEYTAHDILVDLDAESMRDLLSNFRTAEARIAPFDLNNRSDELSRWSFGSRSAARLNVHGPGVKPAEVARLPVQPGNSDLCFEWGPIDSAIAHLKAHGIAVERGPMQRFGARGPGTSVYFRDPDGSLMEFMSYGDAK